MIQFYSCFFSTQLEGVNTEDFEAINAVAFLLSTESSKTIFIGVKDDDLPEADETFTFNLVLGVNAALLCRLFVCFSAKCLLFLPLFLSGAPSFLSTKSRCSNSTPDRLQPQPQLRSNREWGRQPQLAWEALSYRVFDVSAL